MNKDNRVTFSLSDIRAIRLLVLVLGGIGIVMFLITDRDSPLLVVGFISVLTVVPLAAIYAVRRFKAKQEPAPPPLPAAGAPKIGTGPSARRE
jgi:hypothetical protein